MNGVMDVFSDWSSVYFVLFYLVRARVLLLTHAENVTCSLCGTRFQSIYLVRELACVGPFPVLPTHAEHATCVSGARLDF
jgi:hypothetical protein